MVKLLGLELFLKDRPPRSIEIRSAFQRRMQRGEDACQTISLPGVEASVSAAPGTGDQEWRLQLTGRLENPQHIILEIESIWPHSIFCHGYNDWTGSRERRVEDIPGRLRMPLRPLLSGYTDIPLTERWLRTDPAHHRSHGVTYLKRSGHPPHAHTIVLFGALNERRALTWFEFSGNRVLVHLDLEGSASTGDPDAYPVLDLWAASGNSVDALFGRWFEQQNLPPVNARPAAGYTTWYYHYNNVSPADIEAVLAGFGPPSGATKQGKDAAAGNRKKKTTSRTVLDSHGSASANGLDVLQIDDGYQRHVGDWLDLKPSFGRSLRPTVDRIHAAGARAGLWIAPFIAERNSRLFREHPDWIARDHRGRPVRAGFNPLWSYWFYALDLSREEVREYLQMVFTVILHEWGFDFLKLDFLYAAALQPAVNRSRAEHLHDAVDLIHECTGWSALPERRRPGAPQLLGCGIPLSAAAGRFDYCRVGSDVKESWEDPFLHFMNYQERVSTFNSLISTISRRHWNHRAFLNDPDVFFLRSSFRALSPSERQRPIPLTLNERRTLFLLNHIFGSLLFTSDPVQQYDAEARRMHALALPLADPQDITVEEEDLLYTIRFRVNGEYCVAFANLRRKTARISLPPFPPMKSRQAVWRESPLTAPGLEHCDFRPGHTVSLSAHASVCFTMAEVVARTGRSSKNIAPHIFMPLP